MIERGSTYLIARPLLMALFYVILSLPLTEAQQVEATEYVITISTDGSAYFVIEHRFPLESEEDVEAFKQYLAEFEAERSDIYAEFVGRVESLVERASRLTGREMGARGFTISAEIVETITGVFGLIIYEFRWDGFAKIEGDEIILGDVFEGGLYLYERDSLTIKAPEGYVFVDVEPIPERGGPKEVSWVGRRSFPNGTPAARLKPQAVTPPERALREPQLVVQDLALDGFLPLITVALVSALFVVLVARRRRSTRFVRSDVDLVIRILKEAGGAIFQSELVDRTGFSKSKVSGLLSFLEKRGVVERVKRGRERIVILKG